MTEKPLTPMFKWSGGKRRELLHVKQHMPPAFDKFCEPFVGGGAVWFATEAAQNVVGDVNADVINFYQTTKQHGQSFVDELNTIATWYKETLRQLEPKMRDEFKPLADMYYEWRDGTYSSPSDLAKRFYVLRNLAFGGMLRYNRKGKFNVPYGYYKNFKQLPWNERYQTLFTNTQFICGPWQDTVAHVGAGDFVFLDPPYTRAFTKYDAAGDFGQEDHEQLAEWFQRTDTPAMIILNKDDFTVALYGDYIQEEYEFSYGVRYRKDRLSKEDVTTYHFVATNY